ncbi:MAG: hypothetical protein ACFFFC_00640 [Candidatus Thorarchaeota archaeon]
MGEKKTFQGSTISLITQLFGTFMSGQACIAMLRGIGIEDVLQEMPEKRNKVLQEEDIINNLKLAGINVGALQEVKKGWRKCLLKEDGYIVVKIIFKQYCHWCLMHKGNIYDPLFTSVRFRFSGRPAAFMQIHPNPEGE